ncbi:MAG: tetratricopeptide repeat protein, partial [Chloroflexota bacterium]|nr:tetratricopeptide repeat protein [Chloroflexota bacterium]
MNEILNPYIAGAPVTETSMFFGREDVFSWIERSLAGKYVDHILVLHGQRRVGKTSVLKQIPNFLPDQYIQVFFDLQGRTNTTLDRFLWWLAREIARTLKQERGITIPRPDRDDFKADPEYLINEFIPSLRPILGDQDLLLTFDEFDTLDRPDIQESLAEPMIAYLRRLMEMEGLSFIFSIGSAGDKLENMQASYTDFFKSALYRKISFLTRDDCHSLITKPVEGIIQYDRPAVDRIFEISSGHPYFTQLMCHELFSLCQKTGARSISKADVESVLDDVIERGTVNLKFVWDEASDLEKWILAGLAQLEGSAATQKLIELLQEQRVRFSEPDLHSAIIHLRDKDIITEENQFVIHLMRMWLQANRTLDRVREELVEVNPIANRYIEIGDEYRDMGQAAQAIESYQQALEADPGNLKAQSSIGAVHLVGQAYTEALAAFELALQIDDEDVVARTGFCDANLALGDQARSGDEKDESVGFYRKILVINPAHTDARQRLADIYSASAEESLVAGQDDEALSAFNSALEFTPEDDRLAARYQEVLAQKKARVVAEWLGRSDRALARQRWDEAANAVQEALKLDPENPELQARMAAVKDAPRQYKIQAYRAEAQAAIQRGNFEKAMAAIGTAIQLAPEDESLPEWLESTRSDQLNAQLDVYREQARKAITAGDWEAAIQARVAALKLSPDDATLQKELDETQAAQLQAQLDDLNTQAVRAITTGNWAAAITARKNAIKLSPDDPALRKELTDTEAVQLSAQLDTLSSQAEGAIQAGEWDTAIKAYEEAKELAPDDPTWNDKIETTRAAHLQAQLQACREGADSARAAGDWDAAIAALEGYQALEPGDDEIQAEIETVRQGKRQHQLAAFRTQAEAATAAENWDEVVAAWEGYIALEPEDNSDVEEALQHARKYARISSDFDEAQQAIRKRRYGRAIVLLQGIIAQDPTFKSTSRLLVEAVEADQATPIWRRSWVYGVLGVVAVVALGIIFWPRLFSVVTANLGGEPDQTAIAAVDFELGETIEPTITPALALISTDPPA